VLLSLILITKNFFLSAQVSLLFSFKWAGWSRVRVPLGARKSHHRVQGGSGPTHPPIQRIAGALSLGVMRPGREADHSLPSSADVNNPWSYISTPPIRLHGTTLRSWMYMSAFRMSNYFLQNVCTFCFTFLQVLYGTVFIVCYLVAQHWHIPSVRYTACNLTFGESKTFSTYFKTFKPVPLEELLC